MWLYNFMKVLNTTKLFVLKRLILCYVNFGPNFKKKKKKDLI